MQDGDTVPCISKNIIEEGLDISWKMGLDELTIGPQQNLLLQLFHHSQLRHGWHLILSHQQS